MKTKKKNLALSVRSKYAADRSIILIKCSAENKGKHFQRIYFKALKPLSALLKAGHARC